MSTIKVNAIQNTSGVQQYLAKAWVNFNGTGTVAIRASGNVSSITDIGVGDYRINFTSAFPDLSYSCNITAGNDGSEGSSVSSTGGPNGLATVYAYISNAGSRVDYTNIQCAFFR